MPVAIVERAVGTTLAAVPDPKQILVLFAFFAVAVVFILIGLYAAMAVRRWTQRDDSGGTFTFQDLRDLRAAGQINDAEFQAMRATLLAEAGVATPGPQAARDHSVQPPDPPNRGLDSSSDAQPGPPDEPSPPDVGPVPGG